MFTLTNTLLNDNSSQKIILINLLGTDGNFVNDINSDGLGDGWSTSSIASKSMSNNTQTITTSAQYGGIYKNIGSFININDTMYACCYMQSDIAGQYLALRANYGIKSYGTTTGTSKQFLSSYYKYIVGDNNGELYVQNRTVTLSPIRIEKVFLFNLASAFRNVGFIPSKTKVDSVIQAKIAAEGYKSKYTFKVSEFKEF